MLKAICQSVPLYGLDPISISKHSLQWLESTELVEIDQYSIVEPAMKDIMIDVLIQRYDSVTTHLSRSVMIHILFPSSNEYDIVVHSLENNSITTVINFQIVVKVYVGGFYSSKHPRCRTILFHDEIVKTLVHKINKLLDTVENSIGFMGF